MARLLSEIQAMHNPALGAALIWRFVCGYAPSEGAAVRCPLPLTFVVLPLSLHARTHEAIKSTLASSGIRKLEEKLAKGHADLLLAVRARSIAMRPLTLRSLRVAWAAGLLSLDTADASVWSRTHTAKRGLPKDINTLMSSAEKVGKWCSQLTLFELSGVLRVEF